MDREVHVLFCENMRVKLTCVIRLNEILKEIPSMNLKLLIFFTAIFFETITAQEYGQQDGLYYEFPDSSQIKKKNFFNIDNHIYKPGLEFKYSYVIIKKK